MMRQTAKSTTGRHSPVQCGFIKEGDVDRWLSLAIRSFIISPYLSPSHSHILGSISSSPHPHKACTTYTVAVRTSSGSHRALHPRNAPYVKPPCFKISSPSFDPALPPVLGMENPPLKSRRNSRRSTCRRTSSSPSRRRPRFGRRNVWKPVVFAMLTLYSTDFDASAVAENGCCVVDSESCS